MAGCTPVQEVAYIPAQEAAYTLAPAMNHIKVIYLLGPYSLLILKNTECRI
jgi:hypothetical protein